MTDACLFCETEDIDLDGWFLKIEPAHGKIAVIECICPWCVRDIQSQENCKKTLGVKR